MKKLSTLLLSALLAVSLLLSGAFAAEAAGSEADWAAASEQMAGAAADAVIDESISGENLMDAVGDRVFRENESNDYYYRSDAIYHDYTVHGNVTGYDLDWYGFTLSSSSRVMITAVGDLRGLMFAVYDRYGEDVLEATRAEYTNGYYGGNIVCDLSAGTYKLLFLSENGYNIDYTFYFEILSGSSGGSGGGSGGSGSNVAASGTCGTNVSWSLSKTGTLAITGSGPMRDYGSAMNYAPWYNYSDDIESIVVSNGVTTIGENAFYSCENLTSVELPRGLTTIGEGAFGGCSSLTSITIPEDVTYLGNNAFIWCDKLATVNLPASLNTIVGSPFYLCYELENINVASGSSSFTTVGGALFNKAKTCLVAYPIGNGKTSYVVPEGTRTIQKGAFAGCFLTSVEFPESLTTIGDKTFAFSETLKEVYIPVSVTSAGDMFFRCEGLTTISFGGSESQWRALEVEVPDGAIVRLNVKPLVAPTVTVTTSASSGKPYISWKAVEGATGYEVYRCDTKSGSYKKLTSTSTAKLNVTHTGAAVGEDYFYKVRAVNGDKKGPFSAAKGVWCDLARPTLTVTTNATTGKPYISWTKVAGATGYKVYRCDTSKGTYALMYTASASKLNVTHTGAKAGNDYFYKVKAVYAGNPSCDSALTGYKGVWCDLAAPTIKVVNSKSTGKPVISWNKVAGATGYEVYRCSTSTGTYTKMYTASSTKLSVTHTGAKAGNDYFYKVKALYGSNSSCNSALSGYKGVWCDLARPELTVELNIKGKPYLSWNKVANADGYKVYASTDGETWGLLYNAPADDFDVTHTGAKSGTNYYKVVAICSATSKSNSADSVVKSIKVK